MQVFPVVHSTLDAEALAREVATRYGWNGAVRCRLASRGSNDVYAIDAPGGRFALRVSRARHRTREQLEYECDWLAHLAGRGLPVPAPVALPSGERAFELLAPEGARAVVMMEWLDGRACDATLTAREAGAAGELLARIHDAAADFRPRGARVTDTVAKIEHQSAHLERLLGAPARAAQRSLFERALARVREELSGPAARLLRRGAAHGDFQYANLVRLRAGTIGTIDFDDCGDDLLVKDLVTFGWRARYDGLPPEIEMALRAGYESIRPLSGPERAALPLLAVARDLYMLASYAAYVDRIGPVPGFEDESRFWRLLEADWRALEQTV